MDACSRGEVCYACLDPVEGHEQGRSRPVLIVSDDKINKGPSDLCIVLPITTKNRGVPGHIEVEPPEGGLKIKSYVMCEQIRCISRQRLKGSYGFVGESVMEEVEKYVRIFLKL